MPEPAARASEIQRRQEQEIDAQRARAAERPDVLAPAAAPSDGLVFPVETPCFPIRVLSWEGAAPPPALAQAAGAVLNRCVGGRGLRALQEHLIGQLIDGGQVTARVVVPEQSLAAGTLTLRYLPGRISAVKARAPSAGGAPRCPAGPATN